MSLVGFRARNHPQQDVNDAVDDRRTPPDLLAECAALARVDAFDLDAAATAENALAPRWCRNGLTEPWSNLGLVRQRVWCNPPYSSIEPWVAKAWAEWKVDDRISRIAMLLPANRTEQQWWQRHVERYRLDGTLEVYFLGGRRRFDRPGWTKPAKGDRPPFGLCLLVWRQVVS